MCNDEKSIIEVEIEGQDRLLAERNSNSSGETDHGKQGGTRRRWGGKGRQRGPAGGGGGGDGCEAGDERGMMAGSSHGVLDRGRRRLFLIHMEPSPDVHTVLRNDPDEARRLQDLVNCLDSEIDQANDVLRELLERRSTLLAEASYIPCDRDKTLADIRRLESELAAKQLEVADVQAEISSIKTRSSVCSSRHNLVLDDLTQDISRIHQQLNHSRKLLSPILRLPSELLQHIFTFCLPSQRFVPLYPQSAPLLLTSVNRLFREHALTTPSLWASLSIHRNSSGTGFFPHPNVIQLFIERSGAVPLSWSLEDAKLNLHVVDTNHPPMPVSQIVELYVPHAQRWKHVRIDYGSGWVPNTGLDLIPPEDQFSMLETFSIKRGYWLDNREIGILARMLASPRLRGVSWYSQKPYTTLTMPWTQLTQFSINHLVPVREALNIISLCKKLEDVELNMLLPTKVEDESPVEPLRHDLLQGLKLEVAGDPNILFNAITFPNLKRFEISLTQSPRAPPLSLGLFRQFIDRSTCVLEKLTIEEAQLNPDDLLGLLMYLSPSLTELSFQHERLNAGYMNDQILRMMTQPDVHGPNYVGDLAGRRHFRGVLCPNLKFLRLWGVVGSADGVLADMLQSRWIGCRNCRSGRVLDTVFIVLDDDMDRNRHQEDFKRMHELKCGWRVMDDERAR
ncbi:hypothetical protein AGABI2DRAFT_177473 [Agaricus bisporus var. bisporus H97]|uniref:hypothetical protein n=1 Tax=Agaricus bisporus var. bisporus (strain H97 / ATCC MYA-4626 / FGSC 10389) TaxID=936046 RepID=UPI00029F62CD|nr:hypothetical protein AGABI2DRAFT_177473 [Agaricus bisporus var. bisporus H97]EKV49519.1 hypothetical protein AGABI2DRAFT_177473 [Agaricus bisporus var. bisporus H97]